MSLNPIQSPTIAISTTQIFLLKEAQGKTKAMARCILAECFQLTGIRIVDGVDGLFVAYPNDPNYKNDDYRSLFYPISKEQRDYMTATIMEAYYQALADSKPV